MTDTAPPEPRRDKRCDICGRRFARSEHLTRHRLTHTKERPFVCTFCDRSFQRADVKSLHLKKCRGRSIDQNNGYNGFSGSPRKRIRLACNRCRQKKIACNGQEPCSQCKNHPLECEYAGSRDLSDGHLDDSRPNLDGTSFNSDHDPVASSGAPLSSASADDEDPLEANEFALGDDPQQVAFLPVAETAVQLVVPDSVLHHDLDLSLISDGLIDPASMNEMWQISPLDDQFFWFDGADFSWGEMTPFDASFLIPEPSVSSASQQRMTGIMQEYFDRKSRKSSPTAPDKASVMWYSAPPKLEDHDDDVLNVFVNLFHKHVSDTFMLFKEMNVPIRTRPEYTLAMAATGGLFSNVPGSADVVKSLYNDSRRLLLASYHKKRKISDERSNRTDKLITVCTFILLQLYGLCSGDKRSYEFVEAFYGHVVYAMKDYSHSRLGCYDARQEVEDALLLESLYILDCYRVILTHRPPCVPWRHANSFAQSTRVDGRMTQLLLFPAALTGSSLSNSAKIDSQTSLVSLASLCAYLWPATSLSESAGHSDISDYKTSHNPFLWKSDFVEMACDKWLHSQVDPPLSALIVYHHLNVMLHANPVLIQRFAHSPPTSTARDPLKSVIAKTVEVWVRGRDCEIAQWHAERLISSLESAIAASKSNAGSSTSRSTGPPTTPKPPSPTFEAPHTPYAVYYATLILWCGELAADITNTSVASAKAHLVRGEMILSAHRARIAQLLARVLTEIK